MFQVKAILVNIFGGIVNCVTIANGIIAACKEIQLSIPLVVRLEGEEIATVYNHKQLLRRPTFWRGVGLPERIYLDVRTLRNLYYLWLHTHTHCRTAIDCHA